jgi:hypothetical protein
VLNLRLLRLSLAAIAALSATALVALPAGTASGARTAAPDSDPYGCVTITDWLDNAAIAGGGVNKPVTLESPGNTFCLEYPYPYETGGTTYNSWEYQNGDGHCLFDNGGTLDVGAACQANHPNEMFYGVTFVKGSGWEWANVGAGVGYFVTTNSNQSCDLGATVYVGLPNGDSCYYWNFPSAPPPAGG